jgi:hypothetical protein
VWLFPLCEHGGSQLVAVALTRIALVTRVQAAAWLPPCFRHQSRSRECAGAEGIRNEQLETFDLLVNSDLQTSWHKT